MIRVVILESAAADLEMARDFYDAQETGVGEYFLSSVLAQIESLEQLHGIHLEQFGFHRMLVSKFPFGGYYEGNG
ncbi:hypothetical protein [Phragmitibacter flavus]|uniref:hypothetical protein n=1 Tax=Phragmitibacter flavus TaxID=2576071 RepID=UPI00197F277E|nr:hypothetical protein [Phragmitibacter flavus]